MQLQGAASVTHLKGRIGFLGLFCFLAAACDERSFAVTEDDFSGAACGVGGLDFSIRDATKSISVSGGEGPHFTFKRGMTIGSGRISDIRSIAAEGDKVVIQLNDAFTEDLAIRHFEFRNVPEHCVREIKAVLKLLALPRQ
jgi:hypothetical protein